MTIELLRSAPLLTVQDAGRLGLRALGVGRAGALDEFSFRLANLLVGNPEHAAALEITSAGPTLRFGRAACIALSGASIEAEIDGVTLRGGQAAWVPEGAVLRLGVCRRGARVYLAIDGGIEVPQVLGSRSTDLRAAIGGWQGRVLQRGDRLPLGTPPSTSSSSHPAPSPRLTTWWVDAATDLSQEALAGVLPGRDATRPADVLFDTPWRVDPSSNRQALRLAGPPLQLAAPRECISEPVTPGTIQLPPDGLPLILLADAQTTGGYPVIGHVARADLARLAQCRSGDPVYLRGIGPGEAAERWNRAWTRLERMRVALALRSESPPGCQAGAAESARGRSEGSRGR